MPASTAREGVTSAAHDRTWVVWLSLAQLVSWGSLFYTFALLMGPVERELGIGRAQSSLAFSLALLAEGLCAYAVGRWIDRGHERAVMTGGSLLAGACLAAHSAVTSLAGFYLVWTGIGVAMAGTLYAPVFAIVTRRFPQDFRRAIITMTFLGGLASTVFIPLTAALIAGLGWRPALWVLAAFHWLLCAPLHARLLRGAPSTVAHPEATQASAKSQHAALRPLLTSKVFLLIGVFTVISMGVTAALPAHMVSLLRERGLPEALVIAIPACIGVLQVFGRALLYVFEHRFDVHRANRLIPCLIPAGMAVLLAAPWIMQLSPAAGVASLVLFVALFGMGNGMVTIVKGTAIAEYVSREHVASLNGALGFPLALARAGAPLAMGLMWSTGRGYSVGLVVFLGLCCIGIGCLAVAQRLALGGDAAARGGP